MSPVIFVGLSEKKKKRLIRRAHRHQYDEKEVCDIIYALGTIMWQHIPDKDKIKLGTKAEFLLNFFNKYRKK